MSALPNYNLGVLGSSYAQCELLFPNAGYYSAHITVMPGDLYNLQGVPAGDYDWSFANLSPSDPTLVQTVQFLACNGNLPCIYGRRANPPKTSIVGNFNPWFYVAQWVFPGPIS